MLFLMKEVNFVHCDFFLHGKYSFIFYFTVFCLVRKEGKTQCKKALFYIMILFEKLLWVVEIKQ